MGVKGPNPSPVDWAPVAERERLLLRRGQQLVAAVSQNHPPPAGEGETDRERGRADWCAHSWSRERRWLQWNQRPRLGSTRAAANNLTDMPGRISTGHGSVTVAVAVDELAACWSSAWRRPDDRVHTRSGR